MSRSSYPITRACDHEDVYHGTHVRDPYRWLEDLASSETQAWIAAQNALTFSYLEQLPRRQEIRDRLTGLWDYPKVTAPYHRGSVYFQGRNSGLQNQSVLYVMADPKSEGRVLLDPNLLSEDGTMAVTDCEESQDGRWLAYAVSAAGSDWQTWRVREIATGDDLSEKLMWCKFSGVAWLPDGSGFFYARYPEPPQGLEYAGANYNQRLYLHRLGTDQSADPLIYERPDHVKWGYRPQVTDDGHYLILNVWEGSDHRNRVFYCELTQDIQTALPFVELIPDLVGGFEFVGNSGSVFYFRTDFDAPLGRLIAIDVASPARDSWVTLLPEAAYLLEMVVMAHDSFVAKVLHDAHHRLLCFGLDGTAQRQIPMPTLGSILSLNARREDDELFFAFHSFTYPATVYRYDFVAGTVEVLAAPRVDFDADAYVTEQVFVSSKDGTRVPLFLVHRRDWVRDGANPTLLFGYGGFDISMVPTFDVSRLVWLEMGGVLAVANLRGGGEYGETWHAAGTVLNKQNVFDDFIACAEYLVAEKITSSSKLAIEGRSNGGLLIGACLTQRPELFGAALPTVGVLDMLRFHKFTIGWAWVSDYGSSDDPEQFVALYAYSPLHNARPAVYPPTLILTGDHDDRVMPAHSYKFAAALQAAQQGDAPILIRVQTKAGHGMGKPTKVLIEERADIWAFVAAALGM